MTALVLQGVCWATIGVAKEPDCGDKETQLEMNRCALAVYQAADQELTRIYSSLLAKVSDKGKQSLRAIERVWIAYRDKECAFETSGTEGGTIHAFVAAQCLTRITRTHVLELRAQMECEEGDLACGGQ